MAVTVDDIIEAATNGVIRALDARKAGQKEAVTEVADVSTAGLVRSGFFVGVHIIAGGYPPGPPWEAQALLNPQPLPPGAAARK
jgi:hypothetical protein